MIATVRRLRAAESGFSLIELLVTMFVLGLLSTVVVSFFVSMTTTFTRDSAATDSTNVAAIGMNEVTRVIRAGTEIPVQGQTLNNPVFVTAKNEEVTLYAYLDTDSASPTPVKIRFAVDSGRELVETRWNSYVINGSYWAFNATAASSRDIARLIKPHETGESWLFTYYLADGTILPVPGSGTFTTAQLRSIAAVKVTMTVQADLTDRAAPVTIQNTVGIPNLGISRLVP